MQYAPGFAAEASSMDAFTHFFVVPCAEQSSPEATIFGVSQFVLVLLPPLLDPFDPLDPFEPLDVPPEDDSAHAATELHELVTTQTRSPGVITSHAEAHPGGAPQLANFAQTSSHAGAGLVAPRSLFVSVDSAPQAQTKTSTRNAAYFMRRPVAASVCAGNAFRVGE